MPWARAAFTDPGLPGDRQRMVVLKVRVAMGTALPGFLVPAIRADSSVAHLRRRHSRTRGLPPTCGARDQSDPHRCHLRSIGLLAGRVLKAWKQQAKPRCQRIGVLSISP